MNKESNRKVCTKYGMCDQTKLWENFTTKLSDFVLNERFGRSIKSIDELEYSENENIGLIIYESNEMYILDVLIYEKKDNLLKLNYTVEASVERLGGLDAICLFKDKVIELIEENKAEWNHINAIENMGAQLDDIFKFILLHSYNLKQSKEAVLISLAREMEDAIDRYVKNDCKCSVDVILDREEQKLYGCYCSRHNSARVTNEYPLTLFLEKEIIEFCEEKDYFLELAI